MEYGALRLRVMILGQDHLLLGIGAADGRTIAVAALDNLPGTDALNPGDLMGMLLIGGAQYLALVGPRGGEEPLIVHAGDHVLKLSVAIFCSHLGIEGLEAGRRE